MNERERERESERESERERERENAWMQEVQTLTMCEKENTLLKKKTKGGNGGGRQFFFVRVKYLLFARDEQGRHICEANKKTNKPTQKREKKKA
jgi:hypothetical protein